MLCGALGAVILSRYDKAGTGCLLGVILGPIGVIIAWVMRDNQKTDETVAAAQSSSTVQTEETGSTSTKWGRAKRKCPHCAEVILLEAKVCKHCGRDVQPGEEKDEVRPCPYCDAPIAIDAEECPECLVVEPFE